VRLSRLWKKGPLPPGLHASRLHGNLHPASSNSVGRCVRADSRTKSHVGGLRTVMIFQFSMSNRECVCHTLRRVVGRFRHVSSSVPVAVIVFDGRAVSLPDTSLLRLVLVKMPLGKP
jgi:hypothetical protein